MKVIYLLALLLSGPAFSQKIKITGYDAKAKHNLFKTDALKVVDTKAARLSLALFQETAGTELELSGSQWGTGTIGKNDLLILKLSDGTELKAKSTNVQTFIPNPKEDTYTHRYLIDADDIAMLSKHDVVSIRKYLFSDFTDLEIPEQSAKKVKQLSSLFWDELNKTPEPEKKIARQQAETKLETKPDAKADTKTERIALGNVNDFIGKKVELCAPVFITRFYENGNDGATILDFQSRRSGPNARAIIWNEDKKKWGDLPKAFFTGKQVCITGLLYIYEKTPYIQITEKAQLKIMTPLNTDEARFFVKDSMLVSGIIEGIEYSKNGEEPVVLQLRSLYAKQSVQLILKNKKFSSSDAEKLFLHKQVSVSGIIQRQKGELQMALADWDSLQLKSN